MTLSRAYILAKIKTATQPSAHPRWSALIPKRGQADKAGRTDMFVQEAEYGLATIVRVPVFEKVPDAVANVLRECNILKIKAAPQTVLQNLNWSGVDITFGNATADDLAGLVVAKAGVAETGTLVLCSGARTPTALNFLPDVHIVVLREQDIQDNYETVWQALGSDTGMLPRTVNWITGPSRTADIEQTMLLGAHGPRKLVILLINEKPG